MIIRIEKPLLESMQLMKAIPKAEWRNKLTGIIFDADGTIWASNGHICLVARGQKKLERSLTLNIEKTPASGKKYQFAIIDTDSRTCSFIPAFDGWQDASDEEALARSIAVVKAEEVIENREIKLKNPVPAEVKPVTEIVFDADYLAMLPKIADLYEKQEGGKFAFKLTGDNTASLVKVRAGQGYMLTFIIMPIIV